LLFGPVFLAIAWADLPGVSEQAKNLLRYSVGVALSPLPLPALLWGLSVLWGSDGVISATLLASQQLFGLIILIVLLVVSIYLEWKVFRKSGGYVDQAGAAAARVGSAAGVYKTTGDRRAAQQALKFGPGSMAARRSIKGFSDDGGRDGGDGDDVVDSGNENLDTPSRWERLSNMNPWNDDGRRD
jgi:hypothetical protein